MANDDERRIILEMIDSGKITAEEGLHLLESLPEDDSDDAEDEGEEAEASADFRSPAEISAANGPEALTAPLVIELPAPTTQASVQVNGPHGRPHGRPHGWSCGE